MVLKRPFIGDTGEASVHSLFRSPKRQSSSAQYNSFTWKKVLKRMVIVRKNLLCTLTVQVSKETQLEIRDTRDPSYCSLLRSPGRQSSSSWYDSFTQKMVLKSAIRQWHWERCSGNLSWVPLFVFKKTKFFLCISSMTVFFSFSKCFLSFFPNIFVH